MNNELNYFAGIDVGSLSTDVVIIDSHGAVVGSAIVTTGHSSTQAAEKALALALDHAGLARPDLARSDLTAVVATGYGREAITGAAKTITEISCHAAGTHLLFPEARTLIDIGGQDSKVIRLDEAGKVIDFQMNDKCAAGTGRFLEVMAAKLGTSVDDLGRLAAQAKKEISISSVCTVFAESEVVSLVAKNEPREAIVKGLHRAVADRVWSMVKMIGIQDRVAMSGGVAKNQGVVGLFEEKLGAPILVHSEPRLVGALGAALKAAEL
jgi:(R)-2-hydroxyacyl-CoA dehydratese activating ATPase